MIIYQRKIWETTHQSGSCFSQGKLRVEPSWKVFPSKLRSRRWLRKTILDDSLLWWNNLLVRWWENCGENTALILARHLTASPKKSLLTSWKVLVSMQLQQFLTTENSLPTRHIFPSQLLKTKVKIISMKKFSISFNYFSVSRCTDASRPFISRFVNGLFLSYLKKSVKINPQSRPIKYWLLAAERPPPSLAGIWGTDVTLWHHCLWHRWWLESPWGWFLNVYLKAKLSSVLKHDLWSTASVWTCVIYSNLCWI